MKRSRRPKKWLMTCFEKRWPFRRSECQLEIKNNSFTGGDLRSKLSWHYDFANSKFDYEADYIINLGSVYRNSETLINQTPSTPKIPYKKEPHSIANMARGLKSTFSYI